MKYSLSSIAVISMIAGILLVSAPEARAAGDHVEVPKHEWSFDGVFGTFDKAALQRGYKVYSQVCSSCHSMQRLSYRNLSGLGYNEAEIKAIASQYSVIDGPNDEGEMYERTAKPSDAFVSPFANRKAAEYANGGAYPPDLSLIAKARHAGPDHVYGILTGYEEAPEEYKKKLLDGQYYNANMTGHVIAMAPPLSDGMIEFEDGTEGTVEQYAKDVATFLTWASDPHMEVRKRTGIKIFLFLLVFAGIMYATKKKIWANQH